MPRQKEKKKCSPCCNMHKMHGDSLNGLEPSGTGIQAALPLPPASRMERMSKVGTALALRAASQERREQSCPSLQQSSCSTRTSFFSPPQAGAHIRFFFPPLSFCPQLSPFSAGFQHWELGQANPLQASDEISPVKPKLLELSSSFYFLWGRSWLK